VVLEQLPTIFKLDWKSLGRNWEAKADIKAMSDGYTSTAAKGAFLAELKDVSDKSTLKSDEITLYNDIYYGSYNGNGDINWQLIISSDTDVPKITHVKAYIKEQFTSHMFVEFEPVHEKEPKDNGLIYKLPSIQPIESLHIDLREKDLILPVTIFYRKNSEDEWTKLDGRIIKQQADIKYSGVIMAKEFLLKTNGDFGTAPDLRVFRKRTDIVFNSANNAPFVLAYGSTGAKAFDLPSSDFLKGVNVEYLPTARIGKSVKLGGEEVLKVKTEGGFVVPKWLIWGFLVLGIAFLIFLAYKLARELKAS
jgi:hypothetical protein